ncbi:camp-binding domain-like protein [Meira miltonrushii]|uniref:Camp-binding domain-like protein n=1 Tax=Meira miltonrushii TaxID=1280837 RepID=A0A316V992_9BASI|nr:camp-binding domain-like protein [Meira miltonrushii]PWN32045.1 camp-binding domain-like protein [Meira miltonrushii]
MPNPSLPSDYAAILNELNRDVSRHQPRDPLQFCADWFAAKLREERYLAANGNLGTTAAAAAAAAGRSGSGLNSSSQSSSLEDTPMAQASSTFSTSNPFSPSTGSTFGTPATGTGTPFTAESAAGTFAPPANYNFARRTSVSAESLAPASGSPASTPSLTEPLQKTVIPKSDSQMQRIRTSIQNNLLFRNLDEEQERDVLLAMKEVTCDPNTIVIRQGDQGDFFYVVESGSLDVYVKAGGAENGFGVPGGIPGRGSVGSIASTDSEGPATTQFGNTIVPGTNLSATLGDHKVTYGPSDAFGELALLYLQPRAASIVSTSKCVLWALDRVTFRSILMETNAKKRGQLEKFLRGVHLFETLDSAKLSKLADALQFRDYNYGERIIEQGERGTEFFIVVDGIVSVRKRRDPSAPEDDCGTLVTGEYFGELALLNNAPRAASIVATQPPADTATSGKVRVAVLSESAFKRLVGSLASTMELHASTHYYGSNSRDGSVSSTGSGSAIDPTTTLPSNISAAINASNSDVGPSPHDVVEGGLDPRSGSSMGRWVGGLGASPFGSVPAPAPSIEIPPRS